MSERGVRPEAVTSPAPDMEPFADESEIFGDAESAGRHADEEEDGEELFGDNMEA